MTKAEKLLEKLRRRTKELEILLPDETTKNLYPRDEQDSMLAYRLLCHAEIEGFIEALVRLAMEEVWDSAKKTNVITPAAQAMIDFKGKRDFPPTSLRRRPSAPIEQLKGIANDVLNRASKNNGITEKDILNLFLPLGVHHGDFDISWLEAMNDLGRSRGEVAHNSWENHTQYDTTPAKEKDAVGYSMLGLTSLVKFVDDILAKNV
ncbi:HEPN domain-containing protein [Streptomyces sp. NPDC058545]|uniref:HEPN domain-containing protein n=1 Tax=Streptomyces sp. NPDC058545 TaxID=3346544 RepID=UPI00364A6281